MSDPAVFFAIKYNQGRHWGFGVGGVPEVITDGKTGLLVPPKDSKALANAILKLLRDDSMRKRLGAAAREAIEVNFTQEVAMVTIQDFYHTILAETSYFKK